MTINPSVRPDPAPYAGGITPTFTLGDRLRKARELKHLEMGDLASLIDIHRQSVSRYEQGAAIPKRHVILSWAYVTGVSEGWLSGADQPSQVETEQTDEQVARSTEKESNPQTTLETRGNTRVLSFP